MDSLAAQTQQRNDAWRCVICGSQNVRQRVTCYTCKFPKVDTSDSSVANYATNTILLHDIDIAVTEMYMIDILRARIPHVFDKITNIILAKDYQNSKAMCYLRTNSKQDAVILYKALVALREPLSINGKLVNFSHYKRPEVQSTNVPQSNFVSTPHQVERIAEQEPNLHARNTWEHELYRNYYRRYYSKQIPQPIPMVGMLAPSTAGTVPNSFASTSTFCPTNEAELVRYPTPDISKYVYNPNTGFYTDTVTGLYYEPNSQTYWNSQIRQYMYWDHERHTYLVVPSPPKIPRREPTATATATATTATTTTLEGPIDLTMRKRNAQHVPSQSDNQPGSSNLQIYKEQMIPENAGGIIGHPAVGQYMGQYVAPEVMPSNYQVPTLSTQTYPTPYRSKMKRRKPLKERHPAFPYFDFSNAPSTTSKAPSDDNSAPGTSSQDVNYYEYQASEPLREFLVLPNNLLSEATSTVSQAPLEEESTPENIVQIWADNQNLRKSVSPKAESITPKEESITPNPERNTPNEESEKSSDNNVTD